MSTPTRRKWISWNDFAEMWEHIRKGEWNKIAPNLAADLQEIWKKSVMEVFTRRKKSDSYGEVTMEDVRYYLSLARAPGEKPYKKPIEENYIDTHTYVKYGELRFKMRQGAPWQKHEFNANGILSVKVDIPDKTYDDNIDGYRELEADRSFIKASLVLAWPRMLNKIMETISDV